VDSSERSKAIRKLLDFTKNPEIANLAKRLFCSPEEQPEHVKESAIRKISTHWIIAIVAGVGVSYEGVYEIWVRCGMLFSLCVWLVVDSWMILWRERKRNLIGGVLTAVLVVVFAGVGYATYASGIKSQRDAASNGLTIDETEPTDSERPFSAKFIIRNKSPIKITRTIVRCVLWDVTFPFAQVDHDAMRSNGSLFASPLEPGGDGETYTCPEPEKISKGLGVPTCADISIEVEYALPFQKSGTPESKEVRVYTHKEQNGFHWYPVNQTFPFGSCSGIRL